MVESCKTATVEDSETCFGCCKPAIGRTSFLTGTKNGVPTKEYDVAVCEGCYAELKQKVSPRSGLGEP